MVLFVIYIYLYLYICVHNIKYSVMSHTLYVRYVHCWYCYWLPGILLIVVVVVHQVMKNVRCFRDGLHASAIHATHIWCTYEIYKLYITGYYPAYGCATNTADVHYTRVRPRVELLTCFCFASKLRTRRNDIRAYVFQIIGCCIGHHLITLYTTYARTDTR